jgi:putative ATP-binding cassette transporter
LSREFPDATVISIAHRPELAAFHQRKIVLERSRKGAKFVDEGSECTGSARRSLG